MKYSDNKVNVGANISRFTLAAAEKVRTFHRQLGEYAPTPLAKLSALAESIGISDIYVKDESFRFGLNAFKALGGSYAISRLKLPAQSTVITATDGNHGRGVAWTAHKLGYNCVVYMPYGTAEDRVNNIKALGAKVEVLNLQYDDCVRKADLDARAYGWQLVQDTELEGYKRVPGYIMQGYTTMALEAYEQLGGIKPTHILLQAGVGSMAAAVTAFFANVYPGEALPKILIVEPEGADCFYQSAVNGRRTSYKGEMRSMMAGLCCGKPCPTAWKIINCYARGFFSVPDSVSAQGMRALAHPLGSDPKVVSGESGAVTAGLLLSPEARECLGFTKNSKVLCFSTEGDTDKLNYQKITK